MIFDLEKTYLVKGEDHEVRVLANTPDRMGTVPVVFIGGKHLGLYGSYHHSVLEEQFSQYLVEYRAPKEGEYFLQHGMKYWAGWNYEAKHYVIVGGQ